MMATQLENRQPELMARPFGRAQCAEVAGPARPDQGVRLGPLVLIEDPLGDAFSERLGIVRRPVRLRSVL